MSARITGTVSDRDGRGLPGVRVTALNVASNAEKAVITEESEGRFRLLGLQPGTYQISFEMEGFITFVASGIRLSAEQALNLHIRLRRTGDIQAAWPSAAPDREKEKTRVPRQGNFSIAFRIGLNYLAVGDTNSYFHGFYRRSSLSWSNTLETFHSGIDLNFELGYRLLPRLDMAVGIGLIQDGLPDNIATIGGRWYPAKNFHLQTSIRSFPLQLLCRYTLGGSGIVTYGLQGGVLFHFARWSQSQNSFGKNIKESATTTGLGFALGGHLALQAYEHVQLTFDLVGRYLPATRFYGERKDNSGPSYQRAQLWFYEYYDSYTARWVVDLSIGGRPAGPGTRNVSAAKVDFSGLAFRVGMLVRI